MQEVYAGRKHSSKIRTIWSNRIWPFRDDLSNPYQQFFEKVSSEKKVTLGRMLFEPYVSFLIHVTSCHSGLSPRNARGGVRYMG